VSIIRRTWVTGYQNRPLPVTIFDQASKPKSIAFILPGYAYSCQMPLLFYSVNILFNKGLDVACVEYAYSREEDYSRFSRPEQRNWLFSDVNAAFKAVTKKEQYDTLIFVAKSLGTLAVGYLLEHEKILRESRVVWLTPILKNDKLREQISLNPPKSLFVIGTDDPHYDEEILNEMKEITKGDTVVIPKANHGLEISGSIWNSLEALEVVLRAIDGFV
jgi:hypothetical protein